MRLPAFPAAAALGAALMTTVPAHAQGTTSSGTSLLPYTTSGYVGLNVGRPEYKLGCGAGGFGCDDPDASFHVYTGGMLNPWAGVEFGYLHMGEADRQGGTTRGQGLNVSLVGRVPIGQSFNVFGKVGTTYARTKISTAPSSLEAGGNASGWGPSLAVGAGFDFNNNVGLVVQWDRHRMKFAGHGRQDVDAASVGLLYRF